MNTIRDVEAKGTRLLIRADFNVPLHDNGIIADDFRIAAVVPTIQYALSQKARIVLMAHLDSPKGKIQEKLRLTSVQKRLEALLQQEVKKTKDCVGPEAEAAVEALGTGEVLLLENLRFHKEETENDPEFAKQLATLGEVFVLDAFGTAHRNHASITGVPRFLPSVAGLLLERELQALGSLRAHPRQPFVVVVGGSKVRTKIRFIDAISDTAQWVLLGNLLSREAKQEKIAFRHPEKMVYSRDGVMDGEQEMDIGPETRALFRERIREAASVLWAGPLGKIEEERYAEGSKDIARAILESKAEAYAGGGDLAAFLGKHGWREEFLHVSTGGGAMLAYLAGDALAGLEAIARK